MTGTCLAPAKVNLFLHVGAPQPDGFHPLCSAMVFADVGDRISLSDQPGLMVTGPFAPALVGGGENLVSRAMTLLADRLPEQTGLRLDKQLPVASGLGGGSSDAGAALRLLRETFAPDIADRELEALAASLGSDGAACLWAKAVLAEGRGERLSPWARLPEVCGVLVNPGVAVSTAGVYRRFDTLAAFSETAPPARPPGFDHVSDLADWLQGTCNDLQAPALSLEPRIGQVLDALSASPQVLMARMSGSGATCFALCPDMASATDLAGSLLRDHPGWWTRACRFS